MITGVQPKVLMSTDKDGNLVVNDDFIEMFYKENKNNQK